MIVKCSSCGRPLPDPLDQYGPANATLCQTCFLDPDRKEAPPPRLGAFDFYHFLKTGVVPAEEAGR